MRYAKEALDAGLKVVDMSGAFRLGRAEFEKWYGIGHITPELLNEAVYGMPALYARDIVKARLVAAPGCYPTAAILALKPLVGRVRGTAVIFATSGNSGARREVESGSNEISYAYGDMHKHVPEMHKYTGIDIDFNPVVLRSVFQGINMNIRVELSPELAQLQDAQAATALEDAVRAAYAADDLIEIVCDTKDYQYGTGDVNGSHKLLLKIRARGGFAYINALIDNLYKGAAGQAVEDMNLMLGFPRLRGLNTGRDGDAI
jgi:N-acetyl-gamma-glutamyl-phosphate reductase